LIGTPQTKSSDRTFQQNDANVKEMMQGIAVDAAPLIGLEGKSVAHARDFLHKLKIRAIVRHVVEKNQPEKEADNSAEAGLDEADGHFFCF
jgi:hypothetical protein